MPALPARPARIHYHENFDRILNLLILNFPGWPLTRQQTILVSAACPQHALPPSVPLQHPIHIPTHARHTPMDSPGGSWFGGWPPGPLLPSGYPLGIFPPLSPQATRLSAPLAPHCGVVGHCSPPALPLAQGMEPPECFWKVGMRWAEPPGGLAKKLPVWPCADGSALHHPLKTAPPGYTVPIKLLKTADFHWYYTDKADH